MYVIYLHISIFIDFLYGTYVYIICIIHVNIYIIMHICIHNI